MARAAMHDGPPAASWYRWRGGDLELSLKVQVRAAKDGFVRPEGDAYRVRIQAPPVDGKANLALCKFLAESFGVPRSQVALLAGEHARFKRVRISDPHQLPIPIETPAS